MSKDVFRQLITDSKSLWTSMTVSEKNHIIDERMKLYHEFLELHMLGLVPESLDVQSKVSNWHQQINKLFHQISPALFEKLVLLRMHVVFDLKEVKSRGIQRPSRESIFFIKQSINYYVKSQYSIP